MLCTAAELKFHLMSIMMTVEGALHSARNFNSATVLIFFIISLLSTIYCNAIKKTIFYLKSKNYVKTAGNRYT
jgi:hypothetical protein